MSGFHTVQTVVDHYSCLAKGGSAWNTAHMKKVAEAFGYSASDFANIPEDANLGLSCGNPLVVAGLESVSPRLLLEQNKKSADSIKGETVVDLGCGAGFDVFQAARKVGTSGLVIGVDMSEEMLSRAHLNASKASTTNTKFVFASITNIPLDSLSVDCIISNCVINLLAHENKKLCFKEVFRLLKPGGRLAVSDILPKKSFPDELKRDTRLYVGCITGASLVDEYEAWLKDVGFQDVMILDKKADLNIYKEKDGEGQTSSYYKPSTHSDAQAGSSSCCAPPDSSYPMESEPVSEDKIGQVSPTATPKSRDRINFGNLPGYFPPAKDHFKTKGHLHHGAL